MSLYFFVEFSTASAPLFCPAVDAWVTFSLDWSLPITLANALHVDGTEARDDFLVTSPAASSSVALDDAEGFST